METTSADAELLALLSDLRERPSDDAGAAAQMFRRYLVGLERQRQVRAQVDRARFVLCEEWGHYLSDEAAESEVRWTFDRRTWSVASMDILDPRRNGWRPATEEERLDLEESLVLANEEVLTGAHDDYGCTEANDPPFGR